MPRVSDSAQQTAKKIRNYVDANAAIYLLHEALNAGAVVSVAEAEKAVRHENASGQPQLGRVIQTIIELARDSGCPWTNVDADTKELEAAITIGGAVYTVKLRNKPADAATRDDYQVSITSKLTSTPDRGKLFFDETHTAQVKVKVRGTDLEAITDDGLIITAGGRKPYTYQNEILAKYASSILDGSSTSDSCLAVLGTGSGKSVIMASVAQAVGPTIMVVPDNLVSDQVSEVVSVLDSSRYQAGRGPHPGRTSTMVLDFEKAIDQVLDTFEDGAIYMDYDFDEAADKAVILQKLNELAASDSDRYNRFVQAVADYLLTVVDGSNTEYDQIVLGAKHPLFKHVAPLLKDCVVMIDESHQHTFSDDTTAVLSALQDNNTVVALTATPTSKLFKAFGDPIDDMNLHAATKLHKTRPIKAEVSDSVELDAMAPSMIANYFVDYYLQPGDTGYTDPYQLFQQRITADANDDTVELVMLNCIKEAMKANRVAPQRNMAFSGDKTTRIEMLTAYQGLADGRLIAPAALNAAIDSAQLTADKAEAQRLLQQFNVDNAFDTKAHVAAGFQHASLMHIAASAHPTPIDIAATAKAQQITDLSRTVNTYALNLIINISAGKLAAKDRLGDLKGYLAKMDAAIHAFKSDDPESLRAHKQFEYSKIKQLIQGCDTAVTDEALRDKLLKSCPALNALESAQKEKMIAMILTQAKAIRSRIHDRSTIADTATANISDSDYSALNAQASYAVHVDSSTATADVERCKAQLRLGLCTHVISDHTLGTGLSIDDVMNVQLLHVYDKPGIDDNPDSMDSVIQVMQMLGRCVRKDEGRARCQQAIDKRYDSTPGLILRASDAIAADSGDRMRDVTLLRDEVLEHKQAIAATVKAGSAAARALQSANIWSGATLSTEMAYSEAKHEQASAHRTTRSR